LDEVFTPTLLSPVSHTAAKMADIDPASISKIMKKDGKFPKLKVTAPQVYFE
jgi:hypothetical protein